jgi:hypothetical protein
MKQTHIMETPQEIVDNLNDIRTLIAKAFNTPCSRDKEHLRQSYVNGLRQRHHYYMGMLVGMGYGPSNPATEELLKR